MIYYDGFEKIVVPNDHPTTYFLLAGLVIAAVYIVWQFATLTNIIKKKNENNIGNN